MKQKSTKAFTKEPEKARKRREKSSGEEAGKKTPTKKTPTKTTPARGGNATGKEGETAPAAKRGRGRPVGTTKAAMAKRTGDDGGKKAGKAAGVSRKVSAMAKAAAIAKEGLKRPAKYFEANERSDSGRNKAAKLASVSSPGSDIDSPEFLRQVKTPGARTPSRGRGRPPNSSKLGKAAAAAADAANRANGVVNVNEAHMPQSTAWGGAYRMLQSAYEKLQTKYDQLKAKKLQDLMNEAERQQG